MDESILFILIVLGTTLYTIQGHDDQGERTEIANESNDEVLKSDGEKRKVFNDCMVQYFEHIDEVARGKDPITQADMEIVKLLLLQNWMQQMRPKLSQEDQHVLPETLRQIKSAEMIENILKQYIKAFGKIRVVEAFLRYKHENIPVEYKKCKKSLHSKEGGHGNTNSESNEKEESKSKLQNGIKSNPIINIFLISLRMCIQSIFYDFVHEHDGIKFSLPSTTVNGEKITLSDLSVHEYTEMSWQKFYGI